MGHLYWRIWHKLLISDTAIVDTYKFSGPRASPTPIQIQREPGNYDTMDNETGRGRLVVNVEYMIDLAYDYRTDVFLVRDLLVRSTVCHDATNCQTEMPLVCEHR